MLNHIKFNILLDYEAEAVFLDVTHLIMRAYLKVVIRKWQFDTISTKLDNVDNLQKARAGTPSIKLPDHHKRPKEEF